MLPQHTRYGKAPKRDRYGNGGWQKQGCDEASPDAELPEGDEGEESGGAGAPSLAGGKTAASEADGTVKPAHRYAPVPRPRRRRG